TWKSQAHRFGKSTRVRFVLGLVADSAPLAPTRPDVGVSQALRLGSFERRWLDQHSLSLVAVAAARPLDRDRGQRGITPRATREGGVTARQILEMVEVGALQTQRTLVFDAQQAAAFDLTAAFGARRGTSDPEHHQLTARLE